jgi:hypothetical protein
MKKRFYFLLLVLAVILLALLGLGAKAARRLADTTALRSAAPRKISLSRDLGAPRWTGELVPGERGALSTSTSAPLRS